MTKDSIPFEFKLNYVSLDIGQRNIWRLDFPLKYSDGDNLEFYLEKQGDCYLIFDDGSTLWHATGLGVNSHSFVDKLKDVAKLNNITLDNYGDLTASCTTEKVQETLAGFIKTMSWVDYLLTTNEDFFQQKVSVFELAKDLLTPLTSKLICRPQKKFNGYSSTKYSFDFLLGNTTYVDALLPSGNSVNSCIAKVVDIRAALSEKENERFSPIALINDKFDQKLVTNCAKKLGTMMPVYLFSNVEKLIADFS